MNPDAMDATQFDPTWRLLRNEQPFDFPIAATVERRADGRWKLVVMGEPTLADAEHRRFLEMLHRMLGAALAAAPRAPSVPRV